jgi:hypothetical protein
VAAWLRRQQLAPISPRTFAPATTVVDPYAPLPKDLVDADGHRSPRSGVDVRYQLFTHRTGQYTSALPARFPAAI